MNIPNSSLLPRGRKRRGCFGNIVDPQKSSKPWVPNEVGTPQGNGEGGVGENGPVPMRVECMCNSGGFEEEAWLASGVKTKGNRQALLINHEITTF